MTLTASLLKAAPTDASMLHRTLEVVAHRDDPGLTNGVLRVLGLTRNRLPEAMAFISANLSQSEPSRRASAVDAVSRMDDDERVQFKAQLSNIASSPEERKSTRDQANAILQSGLRGLPKP